MNEPISPLDTLRSTVDAGAEDEGLTTQHAFSRLSGSLLEEAGELTGPEYFAAVGRIDALDWDESTGRLTVLATDFSAAGWGEPRESRSLGAMFTDVISQVERLVATASGNSEDEPSSVLKYLREVQEKLAEIRVLIVSNGSHEAQHRPVSPLGDVPVTLVVWDAGDLVSLMLHASRRNQVLDFTHLPGGGLRALGPIGARELSSFLLALPGDLIADLYQAHGSGVLGRNIRAFLQVNNRVNKGIRQTLRTDPTSFFAFNNGLSLTATKVSRALTDGAPIVTAVEGLEIVNGGQTTASLHHAKYRDHIDLADIWVQAKLTVLPESESDDVALHIAQYANSQSPVRMGDLTSNNSFFQEVERLSRTVDFGGSDSQRFWYFERTRGQFVTELGAASSMGAEGRFKARYDRRHRFDKSSLAKFELAWLQMPSAVAAGAERSLAVFMNLENGPGTRGIPDEKYFRSLVAKAILWNEADKAVAGLSLGGYKALDIAYTVALIAHRTAGRVDLEAVARAQDAGDAWRSAVLELAPLVHDNLLRSAGTRNVSSWAKSSGAWVAVQEIEWEARSGLLSGSAGRDDSRVSIAASQPSIGLATTAEEAEGSSRVTDYGSDGWFQLSSWAKETDTLQGWQRGIAFSIGRAIASGKAPSAKQVVQALKILDEANRLGFEPNRG